MYVISYTLMKIVFSSKTFVLLFWKSTTFSIFSIRVSHFYLPKLTYLDYATLRKNKNIYSYMKRSALMISEPANT